MARYEKPPDPRKRPRRNRGDRFDFVPLIGLFLGLIVTAIAIGAAWQLTTRFLAAERLAVEIPTPTVIQLTAPPTAPLTPLPAFVTPTAEATITPQPTADTSQAPAAVSPGFYAAVTGTGGAGLSVRGGPSTDNITLMLADEGTIVLVVEGPTEGGGYDWWKVLLDDGTEGWMASQFLVPAAAPQGADR